MVDQFLELDEGQKRRLSYIFSFGWITVIAISALVVKVFVDEPQIAEDIDALEDAETIVVSLDGQLPSTLERITTPLPEPLISKSVYVPLYRSLYVGEGRAVNKLSATLSIHNTSPEHALFLKKLTYYDGKGEAIVDLFGEPHALPPMASAEFYIDNAKLDDPTTIAATLIEWSGQTTISPPLIEAIVVGEFGAKGFSIHSRGVSSP